MVRRRRGRCGIAAALEKRRPPSEEKIPTSVDLPLSDSSKRVLAYAAEEAERLAQPFIEAVHLLLGLLRENGPAAEALRERGVTLEAVRSRMLTNPPAPGVQTAVAPLLLTCRHGLPENRLAAAARLLQALCEERVGISGSDSQGRFSFTFEPPGSPSGTPLLKRPRARVHSRFHLSTGLRAAVTSSTRLVRVV